MEVRNNTCEMIQKRDSLYDTFLYLRGCLWGLKINEGLGCYFSTQAFKAFWAGSADWTAPIFGQVFKFCPFFNFSFAITPVRIINESAIGNLTLVHILGV